MNDIEAGALATDITDTWRLSPTRRIWHDELLTWIDYDAAARAYTHLRRHRQSRDMDIATFAAEYQRQRGTTQPTPTTGCAHCTDGWQPTTYTINERTYTGVVPCQCRDGRRHTKLHRQILDAREARHAQLNNATTPPPELLNDHTLFDPQPQESEPTP